MNFIYYLLGAVFTFVGVIIHAYIRNNFVLELNNERLFVYLITAAIAGVSFFLADFIMNKVSKS